MSSEDKKSSKKTGSVFVLAALLMGSGYFCYTTYGNEIMGMLPWGDTPVVNKPIVAAPIQPLQQKAPVVKEEVKAEKKVVTPAIPAPSERGSVQALTQYRAELDELEMGIKIETARGKLKEIQLKNESTNILDLLPQPPVTKPVQTSVGLPLTPPVPKVTEEKDNKEPYVIAVGGIGVDLVAIVYGKHSVAHLHVGDKFEGSVVTSITSERVALKKDGKTTYIYFRH